MGSFTQHYNDMQLENVLDGNLNEGIWELMNTPIGKLFGSLKPKTQKLKNLKGINPNDVDEVSHTLWSHASKMLSTDLMTWKKKSRDKGWVSKALMKAKDVYVVDIVNMIVDEKIADEFADMFDLQNDNWLISSFVVYKTSNRGNIGLVAIADPYEGPEIKSHQIPTKKVGRLADKMKNMKFFVVVDKKGEMWFTGKSGMAYKQWLATRQDVTKDELDADIKSMISTYEEKPDNAQDTKEPEKETKPEETKKEVKPKTTGAKTKAFTLDDGTAVSFQNIDNIDEEQYNILGYSIGKDSLKSKLGNNYKSHKPFKKDNKIEGKKYELTNGGEISVIHDISKDTYAILSDDKGDDVLVTLNLSKGQ